MFRKKSTTNTAANTTNIKQASDTEQVLFQRTENLLENIEQTIILIGFAVIIIFALVVTIFDVGKLFH